MLTQSFKLKTYLDYFCSRHYQSVVYFTFNLNFNFRPELRKSIFTLNFVIRKQINKISHSRRLFEIQRQNKFNSYEMNSSYFISNQKSSEYNSYQCLVIHQIFHEIVQRRIFFSKLLRIKVINSRILFLDKIYLLQDAFNSLKLYYNFMK